MAIKRAEFLGSGLAAGVAGVSALYGYKAFENQSQNYTVVPDDVELRAKEVVPFIHQSRQFEPIEEKDKQVRTQFNREHIARVIVALSYLDGGEYVAERSVAVLKRRHLFLSTFNNPLLLGLFHAPDDLNYGMMIGINDTVLTEYKDYPEFYDTILWHEIYHLIQYSRDRSIQDFNNLKRICGGVLMPYAYSAVGGRIAYETTQKLEEKASRRAFLGKAAGLGVAGGSYFTGVSDAISMMTYSSFDPIETQAYIQGGMPFYSFSGKVGFEGVLSKKLAKSYRGNLMIYT